MARIHLLLGPVGAGKSTYAKELSRQHRALTLNLDDWMARLFRPDRPESGVMPWYLERTQRCLEQIWLTTCGLLELGQDVVLEVGLIQRRERAKFWKRVEAQGAELTVYVLDAPREVRRERVEQRNVERGETFSMPVPAEFFELASDLWEPLDAAERAGRDVRDLSTAP
jgi:predicted kinase